MTEGKVMPTIEESGRALYDTLVVMTQLRIPTILDGGTLLGFHRDGTFCKDDHDDIDLTVAASHWKKAGMIAAGMMANGFDVYLEKPRDERNHYSAQFAFKRGEVKIDIMFKEYDAYKQKVWWTVYGGKRGVTYKAVPLELLKAASAHDVMIPGVKHAYTVGMPTKVEEYLTYRYGDWKTPVHRSEFSCYTTDRAILEPNTYEAI